MGFYLLLITRTLDALIHPKAYPGRSRRKLLRYLKQGLRFRLQQRLARKHSFPDRPPLHVFLTSFKREANMRYLLEPLLILPYTTKVTITNNNPETRVNLGRNKADPRVELIDQPVARSCGFRFDVARHSPGNNLLFIDDDIFLTPQQVDRLYENFLANPDSPRGMRGQIWRKVDGAGFLQAVSGDQEVDVLNRVYLVNRPTLETMFSLLEKFGLDECDQLHNADDIFVSFGGNDKPRIHDIGGYLDCPTSYKEDTAIHMNRPAFRDERQLIFEKLMAFSREPDIDIDDLKQTLAVVRQSSFAQDRGNPDHSHGVFLGSLPVAVVMHRTKGRSLPGQNDHVVLVPGGSPGAHAGGLPPACAGLSRQCNEASRLV